MSLPSELRQFASCPKCGGVSSLVRLGDTGVPSVMVGKRKRTRDSDLVKCRDCGWVFRTRQGTLYENMGFDKHGEGLL